MAAEVVNPTASTPSPKPISIPTAGQVIAWTSLAMVASVILQVLVGA